MANPTKLVVDCSTGVSQEIELTDAEVAQMEADAAEYATRKAAEDASKAEQDAAKEAGKDIEDGYKYWLMPKLYN